MFLRNASHVGGQSNEFGLSLHPVNIPGNEIIIYRTSDGKPVAPEDACPHRNAAPDDEVISNKMFEGARMAFKEDRQVLTHVHRGLAEAKTPYFNLGLDAGARRFRKLLERRIDQEKANG